MIFKAKGYEMECCGRRIDVPSMFSQVGNSTVVVECAQCRTKMEITLRVIKPLFTPPFNYSARDADARQSLRQFFKQGIEYPAPPGNVTDLLTDALNKYRKQLLGISEEANEVAKKLEGGE